MAPEVRGNRGIPEVRLGPEGVRGWVGINGIFEDVPLLLLISAEVIRLESRSIWNGKYTNAFHNY